MNVSLPITKRVMGLCLLGALGLTPAGCLTIEQMAPPVESLAPSATGAGPAGLDLAQLRRGRDIYLTGCASCHAVEPIDRYAHQEWLDIIPDMAEETRLDPAETADVRAYILAARRHMQLNAQSTDTPDTPDTPSTR